MIFVSGFKFQVLSWILVRKRNGWMFFFSQKTRKAQKRLLCNELIMEKEFFSTEFFCHEEVKTRSFSKLLIGTRIGRIS
jgi:hypothetical protein